MTLYEYHRQEFELQMKRLDELYKETMERNKRNIKMAHMAKDIAILRFKYELPYPNLN